MRSCYRHNDITVLIIGKPNMSHDSPPYALYSKLKFPLVLFIFYIVQINDDVDRYINHH